VESVAPVPDAEPMSPRLSLDLDAYHKLLADLDIDHCTAKRRPRPDLLGATMSLHRNCMYWQSDSYSRDGLLKFSAASVLPPSRPGSGRHGPAIRTERSERLRQRVLLGVPRPRSFPPATIATSPPATARPATAQGRFFTRPAPRPITSANGDEGYVLYSDRSHMAPISAHRSQRARSASTFRTPRPPPRRDVALNGQGPHPPPRPRTASTILPRRPSRS
jgi:hypothetical protein